MEVHEAISNFQVLIDALRKLGEAYNKAIRETVPGLFINIPTKPRRKRLLWPPQTDLRMFKHRSS